MKQLLGCAGLAMVIVFSGALGLSIGLAIGVRCANLLLRLLGG